MLDRLLLNADTMAWTKSLRGNRPRVRARHTASTMPKACVEDSANSGGNLIMDDRAVTQRGAENLIAAHRQDIDKGQHAPARHYGFGADGQPDFRHRGILCWPSKTRIKPCALHARR